MILCYWRTISVPNPDHGKNTHGIPRDFEALQDKAESQEIHSTQ